MEYETVIMRGFEPCIERGTITIMYPGAPQVIEFTPTIKKTEYSPDSPGTEPDPKPYMMPCEEPFVDKLYQ